MDAEKKPLLSILIPTWNRVQPVLDAVESIDNYSGDVEVVIVDNGSDPAIFEELQLALASSPRIHLFRNATNIGMVRNWNRCLELAKGEWLGLLCSDDRYMPGAIDRLLQVIARHPAPALIIQDPSLEIEERLDSAGSETVRGLRLPIASGNFWHRKVYEELGGFDERLEYSADGEYWYRAALSFPVIKVRSRFAEYLAHGDNYMWATWLRPDYLQQTELLARTVAGYIHRDAPDRALRIEHYVEESIWQTLLTILACTFLKAGKHGIFKFYLPKALDRSKTLPKIFKLIAVLGTALAHKCRKLCSNA